tara:strand:+ start:494 stop:2041 length:1548 start_codon:yes stop_codon:yes gene_type:complete
MSIRARRNSLLKSSISINTIRDSAVSFNEGLAKSNTAARDIVQSTNENNIFKRRLIGKDNEFFRRRRENVRRKDREDELEASSVQGIAKRTGSLSSSSTRGFLGRILDFFGIVLIGWFVNNLPKIIEGISKLIQRISKLVGILTGFVGSITNFLVDMGTGITNAITNLFKFPFSQKEQEARESLESAEGGVRRLTQRLINGFNLFGNPANVGLKSFDEGLIIPDEDPNAEQGDSEQAQDNATTDESENTEKKERPKGFMRALTGAVDFATFGMTDLDKRGDLFGNKEKEKEKSKLLNTGNDNFVQRNPSFILTEKQRNEQIERENDKSMMAGIDSEQEIQAIKSKELQSQGETVESKNQETQRENDDKKENDGVLTKLNGFMSNMFGTKTKRDNDKEKETDTMAEVDAKAQEIEGKASELKSAMEEFTSKIEKPDEGDKGASITPITRQRNNLGGRRNNTSSTIYMVEKPVNIGNDNSVGAGGGGGGSSLNSVNLQDSDAMKKGIKNLQSVILAN